MQLFNCPHRFVLWGLLLLSADIFTKQWAQIVLSEQSIELLPPLLSLQLHFNTGIAFSLPLPSWLQIVASVAIIAGLLWWGTSRTKLLQNWAVTLIIAGAIGNLYERMMVGAVTDFIAVWQFPVFNLADAWVSLGVILLLILESYNEK